MPKFVFSDYQFCLHAGAGTYIQGKNALSRIGELLQHRQAKRPLIIAGKTAYEKVGQIVHDMFKKRGYECDAVIYGGPCTIQDTEALCQRACKEGRDCIVGMGGGKVLDLSKAVADFARLPVFCVPTIAATCAAVTPLSAMYAEDGKFVKNLYHTSSVAGVVADLDVLVAAPPRYLAAGIADAFAKSCEYSSFQKSMKYETSDFGRFMGYRLALPNDEILLKIGRDAYKANIAGRVNRAFCDAVSCVISVTGVISGMGAYAAAGGARFAVAHAFNELIRGHYVSDVSRWLHGELVGVGVLCQMALNGRSDEEIMRRRTLMQAMGLPTSLNDLQLNFTSKEILRFVDELIELKQFDASSQPMVYKAIETVAR